MNEMQRADDITVRNVDATLTHGQMYTAKLWDIFLIYMLVFSAVIIAVSVAVWIFSGDKETLFAVKFVFGFGIVLLLIMGLLCIYIMRGRRRVKRYLEDAEILNAKATSSGSELQYRHPLIFVKATSLAVKFRYNGKRYLKTSKASLQVYNKYADKEIKIAYSPKYDEVMLLKASAK